MIKEIRMLEDGRVITITYEDPEPISDPETDNFLQEALDSSAQTSSIFYDLSTSIKSNDYDKFCESLNLYQNHLREQNPKDINIANRKVNISFFLDFLANKPENHHMDTVISFLEKGEHIKKEFIALCLWSLYQENKTEEYLSKNSLDIPDNYYDMLFDVFQPQKQLMSKLPLGISDEKDFLKERKTQFFSLNKKIFYDKLNEKIPSKNSTNNSKIKI